MADRRVRGPIGTTLRIPTGVDEEILDQIPAERARYTAMGGVVLGTALMAVISLSVALYFVFDGPHLVTVLFVPVWGAFILFLDRWLMSSPGVAHTGQRLRKMLPRVVLAAAFGVVIAEPLLLGVFRTAIDQRIRDDRVAAQARRESDLRQCNPVPGTPEAAGPAKDEPRCDGARLAVTTESEAKQRQVDDLKQQAATLQETVDKDSEAYAALTRKARQECVGAKSDETTGVPGRGDECLRLEREAREYRTDHRIDENTAKLSDLNARISALTDEVGEARASTAERIDRAIDAELRRYRDSQRDEIGLLERFGTLDELTSENGYMRSAEWALRMFFILVDALPVLLKFLLGRTTYDSIVADRLARQRRAQQAANETQRRKALLQQELDRHRAQVEHFSARQKVEFDARYRHLEVAAMREDITDRRASYLLGDSDTIPVAGGGAGAARHVMSPEAGEAGGGPGESGS